MILNINTDAVVKFTNTLEKMHKSALPVSIRGAINKAAFNTKQVTMPKIAERTFTNRQPNFFKANSRVEMAKGFDVKTMKAVVGFTSQSLKGGNNFAVKDLEDQEYGGTIKSKSFIPLDPARSGGKNKPVRPGNRLASIKGIVDARKAKGKTQGQRFAQSVAFAGEKGHVLAEYRDKIILWRVNSLTRTKKGQFKLTPLYSFKESRSVQVNSTGFMKKASLESAESIEFFFIAEAKKQIEKLK
jgi:hypothetical protein